MSSRVTRTFRISGDDYRAANIVSASLGLSVNSLVLGAIRAAIAECAARDPRLAGVLRVAGVDVDFGDIANAQPLAIAERERAEAASAANLARNPVPA